MEKLDDCYGMETGPSDVHSTLGSSKSENMSMGVVQKRQRQWGGGEGVNQAKNSITLLEMAEEKQSFFDELYPFYMMTGIPT